MLKIINGPSFAGAVLVTAAVLGFADPAHAVQRTFVSTAGNDANVATACAATTPCRTFAVAITVTDSGGEIVILGSGGYGSFTITQAVSINAPSGVHAAITALTGDGLTINAPGATVTLNGLAITGVGTAGTKGINVLAAQSVILNSCRVVNFGTGVVMAVPAGSTGSGPTISISDSFIGFSLANGVEISGTSGSNSVGGLIVNSQIMRNSGTAIVAGDRTRVSVANSAVNNNNNALQATATNTAARLYVASSSVNNISQVAVRAGPAGSGNAQVTLCDNSINYVNGATGTAFLRDPDVSCTVDTCRIFSCGNILFGLPLVLENPTGVVEPIGAANGPITK